MKSRKMMLQLRGAGVLRHPDPAAHLHREHQGRHRRDVGGQQAQVERILSLIVHYH